MQSSPELCCNLWLYRLCFIAIKAIKVVEIVIAYGAQQASLCPFVKSGTVESRPQPWSTLLSYTSPTFETSFSQLVFIDFSSSLSSLFLYCAIDLVYFYFWWYFFNHLIIRICLTLATPRQPATHPLANRTFIFTTSGAKIYHACII